MHYSNAYYSVVANRNIMKVLLLISIMLSFLLGILYGSITANEKARNELFKCHDKNICKIKSLSIVLMPNGRVKQVK
jgi:hypothetical protein